MFACAADALARGSAIFGLGRVKKPMRSPHGIRSIIRSIIMMASAQQCQQQTAAQGCRREERQKGSAAAIQTGSSSTGLRATLVLPTLTASVPSDTSRGARRASRLGTS